MAREGWLSYPSELGFNVKAILHSDCKGRIDTGI